MRGFDYCFLLDPSHPSNMIGRAMGIAALNEKTSYRMEKDRREQECQIQARIDTPQIIRPRDID